MPSFSLSPYISHRLAGTAAVYRGGRWWLDAHSGAVPSDDALTRALDRHAADLAAANRAVAALEQA
ncbi:hypothetical protein [Streptomyces ochraceiscleroticus]|uniref:Uncharacterized protein n=1 Tax=Streptomyces ochraceiscleroticus TaxID=47761 RepID=A0ABW1MTT7_9ACTN|nr:hypothetical protein [Streptomyces ochraceiscleroticus]